MTPELLVLLILGHGVRVRVRVGGGMGHLKIENTQVVPPPAFYCINHNQARPLQRVRVRVRVSLFCYADV